MKKPFTLTRTLSRRSGSKSAKGTIDAFSFAFGQADPVPSAQTSAPGTLTGGHVGPLAYTQYERTWAAPLAIAPENAAAQSNLAWLLATSSDPLLRNGPEAVSLAERANQVVGGNQPVVLRIRSAAVRPGRYWLERCRAFGRRRRCRR